MKLESNHNCKSCIVYNTKQVEIKPDYFNILWSNEKKVLSNNSQRCNDGLMMESIAQNYIGWIIFDHSSSRKYNTIEYEILFNRFNY